MPNAGPAFGTITYVVGQTLIGPAREWRYGYSVAGAGDVDGDGVPDLIIGMPEAYSGGFPVGGVQVVSGATGQAIHTFYGDVSTSQFGLSVASAGDVDGDGVGDVIVGMPGAYAGGFPVGGARVFSGATGATLHTFYGDHSADQFGYAVTSLGDINGDGRPDLAVGIPGDDDTGANAGAVRIFSGATGAALFDIDGTDAHDAFGRSVAAAGDVNGDGVGDIIVGAYLDDANGHNSGSARVISGATGQTLHIFHGDNVDDWFGYSVASAGDVDGDGRADLVVGAIYDDNAGEDSGSIRVFSGATGAVLYTLHGDGFSENFGASLASIGDVNGDGRPDLIVGFTGDDDMGHNAGGARIVSGADGRTLFDMEGSAPDDWFGMSVAAIGDLNADGIPDLMVGAHLNDAGGTRAGAVRVMLSVGGGLLNGAPVHAEGGAPTVLDGDVVLTDPELDAANNFAGASLTFARVGGANADDLFSGSGAVVLAAGGQVMIGALAVGSFTQAGGQLSLTFNAAATSARADQVMRAIAYSTLSNTPPASVAIRVTFADGHPTEPRSASGVVTVTILPTDDPAVARDDAVAAGEAAVTTGSVFADNLSGPDHDPEGGAFSVIAVNGSAAAVGSTIALASGALLRVNADGTFSYDPNGRFAHLPGPASGAANRTTAETFTYTLTGGGVGTVTLTVHGQDTTGDILIGTPGADVLDGGVGIDTADYSNAGAGVRVDLRVTAAQDTLGAGPDQLAGLENLTGSAFNDTLFGDAGANVLTGGAGADVLLGLGGDDTLIGGAGAANQLQGGLGNDLYVVTANDTVVEALNEGYDTVRTALTSHTLRDHVEALIFTSDSHSTGHGNALANQIVGAGGNDVLAGHGGLDILNGGAGTDTASYAQAAAGVTASLAAGAAINDGDGSNDVLVLIENLTGSAFNDALTGDAQANALSGQAGNDLLNGRGGADLLQGGLGTDTASYADATGATTVRLDLGSATDGEGGTDILQEIENIVGSAFNDILIGDGGANTLEGGPGGDSLTGGAGADVLSGGAGAANTLIGGEGDDTYLITAADTVVEQAGQGHDLVRTDRANLTLAAHVEDLTYIGSGNFAGTGNALANVITGGNGLDTLAGGGGDDTLNGGAGQDLMLVSGLRADYAVVDLGGGGYRVTDAVGGRDGIDTTQGVERIRFSDGETVTLASLAVLPAPSQPVGKDGGAPLVLPGSGADDFMPFKDTGALVRPAIDDLETIGDTTVAVTGGLLTVADEGLTVDPSGSDGGRHDHDGWLF